MADILYFDINSGISGDMTIAALLDLGLNEQEFLEELAKLNLEGYQIEISKIKKNGITASDFKVILESEEHPDFAHDHHEGCSGCGNHDHEHHDNNDHHHDDSHQEKNNHHHQHEHLQRNFNDIKNLIEKSSLSDFVKNLSIEIFAEIAEAEAEVHAKDISEVHFHEVGAVDSIVDIVGTAVLIEMISPEHIYASPLSIGSGVVDTAHGIIPVPAPATAYILKGVPVYSAGVKSELVTPTGAALIKTLAEEFIPLPEVEIEAVGYGAGKKDLETANLLRVFTAKKKAVNI